ncbi:TIGR00730 family Rossman fold protein [Lutimaribacter marinistellae]|uniref:Cytokinin riboside 5'-monophosphate phosphoribohydrolase n=1 Tax=Lutimaribacter marinistellae TaxID=1820329 RepID=A0ABV7TM41_9RHOB
MTLKSVCVYCGSRPGANPAYAEAAKAFGTALATEGWRLVYGAGDVGLMGEVARAAQTAGGETFGVIPVHLLQREVGKRDLTRFVVTETMHERKKVMIMNADAVVVLPGGPGSLDELFEALTWRQLGLHDKPILVMNVEGYWDGLRALVDRTVSDGFAEPSLAAYLTWVDGPDAAMAALRDALS